jgi:outer membrane lipopolysaccharide assembly protein LptE/RlpB
MPTFSFVVHILHSTGGRDERMVAMRKLTLVAVACLELLIGCGYHVAGTATHIPADVRTLAVPIFVNDSLTYHTNVAMTNAVIHELDLRTRLRVVPDEDTHAADAILHGTVLTQSILPLTYDSDTGQSSSFLVTVTAKVELDASDGRVLYKNDNYVFRQQYQSTQVLSTYLREDSPAVQRLSRDFAQALVGDMMDSF